MAITGSDSLHARRTLDVARQQYDYFGIAAAVEAVGLDEVLRLPPSMKVLLENLVRLENGRTVTVHDVKAVSDWYRTRTSTREIAVRPARVLRQDFTGVPAVVDLTAMRDAMGKLGGDPKKINPLSSVDLVIGHSVMVGSFGNRNAFTRRNRHRPRAHGHADAAEEARGYSTNSSTPVTKSCVKTNGLTTGHLRRRPTADRRSRGFSHRTHDDV
jgi:aconitate hydratase